MVYFSRAAGTRGASRQSSGRWRIRRATHTYVSDYSLARCRRCPAASARSASLAQPGEGRLRRQRQPWRNRLQCQTRSGCGSFSTPVVLTPGQAIETGLCARMRIGLMWAHVAGLSAASAQGHPTAACHLRRHLRGKVQGLPQRMAQSTTGAEHHIRPRRSHFFFH